MTSMGISSVSGLVHLTAKKPKTVLALVVLTASWFYAVQIYKPAPVLLKVFAASKDHATVARMKEPPLLERTQIGSCKIYKCTPLADDKKAIAKREAIQHMRRQNAIQAFDANRSTRAKSATRAKS
jgi:hypothetical protein